MHSIFKGVNRQKISERIDTTKKKRILRFRSKNSAIHYLAI